MFRVSLNGTRSRVKLGNTVHHYSRFIYLWKDCDPELRPMVEDAERRLDALLQEPTAS